MAKVGELIVELKANFRDFRNNLDGMRREVGSASRAMERDIAGIGRSVDEVTSGIGRAGALIRGVTGLFGVSAAVGGAAAAVNQVIDFNRRTGDVRSEFGQRSTDILTQLRTSRESAGDFAFTTAERSARQQARNRLAFERQTAIDVASARDRIGGGRLFAAALLDQIGLGSTRSQGANSQIGSSLDFLLGLNRRNGEGFEAALFNQINQAETSGATRNRAARAEFARIEDITNQAAAFGLSTAQADLIVQNVTELLGEARKINANFDSIRLGAGGVPQ